MASEGANHLGRERECCLLVLNLVSFTLPSRPVIYNDEY